MARHDNDTWDLATGVGLTATLVAAARAVATSAEPPLINDPFAAPLVHAVGVDFFTQWANGELHHLDREAGLLLQRFVDVLTARTRYFDAFVHHTATAGIRQVVNLASGLDTRSYRFHWPPGTTVFEIDQPQVLAFKTATLAGQSIQPRADLRAVPIDLRHDWPTKLRRSGFDAEQATAWIAEGLLPFLSPDGQDLLLDNVTALSAPGSQLATEIFTPPTQDMMRPLTQWWHEHNVPIDLSGLEYGGNRNDIDPYLDDHGWQSVVTPISDLAAERQPLLSEGQLPFTQNYYCTSTLHHARSRPGCDDVGLGSGHARSH